MIPVRSSRSISAELPGDVADALDRIREATGRDERWLLVRALRFYLVGEGAEIIAAIDGEAEIEAGKSHDMDDVLHELDAIVNSDRAA